MIFGYLPIGLSARVLRMDELWRRRFRWLLWLFYPAIGGVVLIVFDYFGIKATGSNETKDPALVGLFFAGFLLIFPVAIYGSIVTIWHWKSRYRGKHSDLWGALLLIEVSGWFKLIYLLRHILPDAMSKGRYRLPEWNPPSSEQ
jgi:hypothetical protein